MYIKYNEDIKNYAIELVRRGKTVNFVSKEIGVCNQTLRKWINDEKIHSYETFRTDVIKMLKSLLKII